MKRIVAGLAGIAAAGVLAAAPLVAQETTRLGFVEGRGGLAVPTFDVSDIVTSGATFGGTIGLYVSPRLALMGEVDYAMHEDEATGTADINTVHYMGKVGLSLTGPRERGWEALVNVGAGAVTFDADGSESSTHFAINAGAKLAYNLNPSFGVVLSPQGDIAFVDEDDFGSSTAWIWPFTAGLRVRF